MGRVLIVEDEILVALEMEEIVVEIGFNPVGIAADSKTALELAPRAEIALVDLNLRDGPSGVEIGRHLSAQHNLSVVFVTANPNQLGNGIPGTIGVITKPANAEVLANSLRYALQRRRGSRSTPPKGLKLFDDA